MESALEGGENPSGVCPVKLANMDEVFRTEFLPVLDLIPSFKNLVKSQVQAEIASQSAEMANQFQSQNQIIEHLKNELYAFKASSVPLNVVEGKTSVPPVISNIINTPQKKIMNSPKKREKRSSSESAQ
ncbi:hypothetical protein JTB14_004998 [Gonioctena quinquepunctata]|nr:hypothetical protein JTB14_004998 [Gonioctena quinquepunctata]